MQLADRSLTTRFLNLLIDEQRDEQVTEEIKYSLPLRVLQYKYFYLYYFTLASSSSSSSR